MFEFCITLLLHLYLWAILIGTFVGLVLALMLPIAAYKRMKAQIRKLENEKDELKRQISRHSVS